MSTRAQIGFFENPVLPSNDGVFVYKHSDGYPEGVLPLLTEFCQSFNKYRGLNDTDYAMARYIIALGKEQERQTKELNAQFPSIIPKSDKPNYTGIGVGPGLHGDIEYFYAVSPTKIEVYACGWDSLPKDWKLEKTVELPH